MRDYTGLDFDRIEELCVVDFWVYLRDAFIFNYSQTPEGIEYLENCYRLNQTKPETAKLRAKFGK